MRVLIVSSNRQKVQETPLVAFPSGPAYIAGAALEAGHDVEVFDACFTGDIQGELSAQVKRFDPEAIAVSIRNIGAGDVPKMLDLRLPIKEITDCLKRATSAPIVLGGPAFWNFGPELLEYLDMDYGIRGEGELTFPTYLEALEAGGDINRIPGCVFRDNGIISQVPVEAVDDLDSTPFPAFELFDIDAYNGLGTFPAIFTKRGCSFHCTHCPRTALEGSRYRLKSPARVIAEIERARSAGDINMFYFIDNLFNFPLQQAREICEELVERKTGIAWTTDSVTPLGGTEDFCRLMKESGCVTVCLAIEHGSASMLERMKRGYTTEHIREAAANIEKAGIPYLITLLLGGPGETPDTIREAIELVDDLPAPQFVLATVGIGLEHNLGIIADAIRDGQLADESELFEGRSYLSPALPEDYLKELVATLRAKGSWVVQGVV